MVYTVGNTKNYLKCWKDFIDNFENGEVFFKKLGKEKDYKGGIIFRYKKSAQKYLNFLRYEKEFSVWGVMADWNKDCYDRRKLMEYWETEKSDDLDRKEGSYSICPNLIIKRLLNSSQLIKL